MSETETACPPKLATLLLGACASKDERYFLLGDLEEEFRALHRARGRRAALAWYWSQALRSVPPLVPARASSVVVARSTRAAAAGVVIAIGSGLVLARGMSSLVGPCAELSLPVIGLGVAGIALISSTSAGWASRCIAGRRDLGALASVGLVVVMPEALCTVKAGAFAPVELIPLLLAVAATAVGLTISDRSRAAAQAPLLPGDSA